MMRLRVLPEAEEELAQAARWYEERRPGLGIELVVTVDLALQQIREAPDAYPLWQADRPYRKLVMRRFPYVVMFTVHDDVVEVLAIAHAKRRPGYWADRKHQA
jgi:plasmid stabilization system protein ParE